MFFPHTVHERRESRRFKKNRENEGKESIRKNGEKIAESVISESFSGSLTFESFHFLSRL